MNEKMTDDEARAFERVHDYYRNTRFPAHASSHAQADPAAWARVLTRYARRVEGIVGMDARGTHALYEWIDEWKVVAAFQASDYFLRTYAL